jgi:SAM-dependent methyltransferase
MNHKYDGVFFDYIESGARASARCVIAVLRGTLEIGSVLDVGCGRGAWLVEWAGDGVPVVAGIDGDYVDRSRLAIPNDSFNTADISANFDLDRKFDLVQCLEVGEHIPTARSAQLVANLVRHGAMVLFSAATPGQGGEFHINEQPLSFWRQLFHAHDFHPFDFVRPRVAGLADVEPWYRYNTMLYVRSDTIERLPAAVSAARLAPDKEIPEVAPLQWRLRCAMLRHLPANAVTQLAVIKHRLVLAGWGRNGGRGS